MPRNVGNSNFYFLYGSAYGNNAVIGNGQGAGMGNPNKALAEDVDIMVQDRDTNTITAIAVILEKNIDLTLPEYKTSVFVSAIVQTRMFFFLKMDKNKGQYV